MELYDPFFHTRVMKRKFLNIKLITFALIQLKTSSVWPT